MSEQFYELHCNDCLAFLSTLKDKSIDVIITDPPYGISLPRTEKTYGDRPDLARKATDASWDDAPPPPEFFSEIRRVSKEQIIFGGNFFLDWLPSTKCYIVWDKRGTMPDVPYSPVEWLWTSFDKTPKRYIVINHGFIKDSKEERVHPTQKPLLLLERIVEDFTKQGDVILDPYMGSGTTGEACIKLGRSFIGVDIQQRWVDYTESRIEKAWLETEDEE